MKSTLKDGAGKNLLVESTIFTGRRRLKLMPFSEPDNHTLSYGWYYFIHMQKTQKKTIKVAVGGRRRLAWHLFTLLGCRRQKLVFFH